MFAPIASFTLTTSYVRAKRALMRHLSRMCSLWLTIAAKDARKPIGRSTSSPANKHRVFFLRRRRHPVSAVSELRRQSSAGIHWMDCQDCPEQIAQLQEVLPAPAPRVNPQSIQMTATPCGSEEVRHSPRCIWGTSCSIAFHVSCCAHCTLLLLCRLFAMSATRWACKPYQKNK